MPANPPSTDWTEDVSDDEDARHAAFAETIVGLQSRISRKAGPGRAFHRKQVAALRGRLTVPGDLPAYAAHGLFAQAGEYAVVIRMSNGAMVPQPDAVPDIRGFALSVRGLAAPGALGTATDRQDFLLINRPAFGFRDSRDFAELVPVAIRGQSALLSHLTSKHGIVGGGVEMARQVAGLARPFSGFATSDFHSCAPVAWGPYAAHVHVQPVGAGRNLLAWRDFGGDIRNRIARAPLRWNLQAQFFTDPDTTPIEDGRRAWRSPKVTVGLLQAEDLANPDEIAIDHFDPWMALVEHRPLGEIMRARRAAYVASFRNRA
ncbi:MAG: hypothetical protein R2720_02050 [Candidatus Nanopelagicales bacterium]